MREENLRYCLCLYLFPHFRYRRSSPGPYSFAALRRATLPPGEGMVRCKQFDKLKYDAVQVERNQDAYINSQGP